MNIMYDKDSAHPYSKSDVFFTHCHFLGNKRCAYCLQVIKKDISLKNRKDMWWA